MTDHAKLDYMNKINYKNQFKRPLNMTLLPEYI